MVTSVPNVKKNLNLGESKPAGNSIHVWEYKKKIMLLLTQFPQEALGWGVCNLSTTDSRTGDIYCVYIVES